MSSQMVRSFDDLIAWQKARELTKCIYQVSNNANFAKDFGLAGQIRRASVSIMANIAEGSDRPSTKEFLRFLGMAKASCAEVRSHLYVARDIQYLNDEEFKELNQRAHELLRIIAGLRLSLQNKLAQSGTNH